MRTAGITACVLSLALGALAVFAGRVTVTNVTAVQRPNAPIVDIYYELLNPSGGLHNIAIEVSTNSGTTYSLACMSFSGATGAGVATGMHKQVVWFAAGDLGVMSTTVARVRVTATDTQADTNGMVLIPAGTFSMGNCMTNTEGYSDELPLHTVRVSAAYMDKCEVSKAQWDDVYSWAITNTYSFDNPGDGKAPSHPVQTVSWYDCVKWCNARSQKEGRTPCYYVDAAQTAVYKTGQSNIWNEAVKWGANGYRLPTEAEWEKAARGDTPGHRFPWSDADWISFDRANYNSYWEGGAPKYSYDHGTTNGFHPLFATGAPPYTSPAGYFAAGGYGLCDMAGNVFEWCWDWYGAYSSAAQSDPRGPENGTHRVLRGGSWNGTALNNRAANRNDSLPGGTFNFVIGFRCVRGL